MGRVMEGSSGNGMLKESRGTGQKAGHCGVPTFESVCEGLCAVCCVLFKADAQGLGA